MRGEIRRKLEMAARVREFLVAHAGAESDYAPVLERLHEGLKHAQAIALRQNEGLVNARAARAKRKALREDLHFRLIPYLVAVGSVVAKERIELRARFRLPDINATNSGFLTSVKVLVAAAEEQKEVLLKEGMAESLLDDLHRTVGEFEAAIEATNTGRRDHIGARAELEVITAELLDQIKVADGITRYRFGMAPEIMAMWKAVRRVPGVPKRGADGAEPPESGGIVSAA